MGARSTSSEAGVTEAFDSCSHGAGRWAPERARLRFTLADPPCHGRRQCRKDTDVIDDAGGAYKPIEAVMEA
jgi:RNA-splicing ligase RtcB